MDGVTHLTRMLNAGRLPSRKFVRRALCFFVEMRELLRAAGRDNAELHPFSSAVQLCIKWKQFDGDAARRCFELRFCFMID